MARNRGRPTLREITHAKPTAAEHSMLTEAAISGGPIVTAILGAAMIELELDGLLRQRFPRITDSTWASMVGENGPFNTFDQKITAAYAFRMFDEATKDNLKIIKGIRNAFAHAKKLFDFDHELVVAELKKIKIPNYKKRNHKLIKDNKLLPNASYVLLCMSISSYLVRKTREHWKGKNKRLEKKQAAMSPLARYFIESAHLPKGSGLSGLRSSLLNQNGDPSPPTRRGLLDGLVQLVPKDGPK